eukprot:GILJ01002477.1.p1 GENE.GILJ01002477.1~~GILJ01002477.1.p1  ORF type:complete len:236 (-),score=46.49 GILJ01002477.1:148-855(-)
MSDGSDNEGASQGKARVQEYIPQLQQLLKALNKNENAFPFTEPVDWKALGLMDYPKIIKHPMDLSTIKKKLDKGKYTFVSDFLDDVHLVWNNCTTYNQPGSDVYNMAVDMRKSSEKLLSKLNIPTVAEAPAQKKPSSDKKRARSSDEEEDSDIGDTVSFKMKQKFSQRVKKLTSEMLGRLVRLLQKECERAVTESGQDELEINVDAVDVETFRKMDKFVRACLSKQKKAKKAKAK